MSKCIIFAIIAFAAVVSISAKPSYAPALVYSSPIHARPAVSYNAPSAAASSVAHSSYLYHVPSYIIDSGRSGYTIYDPNYVNSYNGAY